MAGVLVVEETRDVLETVRWEVMVSTNRVPIYEGTQRIGSCGNLQRGLRHVYIRRLQKGEESNGSWDFDEPQVFDEA